MGLPGPQSVRRERPSKLFPKFSGYLFRKTTTQQLVGKHAHALRVVTELNHIEITIGALHQMALRTFAHSPYVAGGGDCSLHGSYFQEPALTGTLYIATKTCEETHMAKKRNYDILIPKVARELSVTTRL